MADTTIYQDVKERTGGDIYIGVVGPVRTGKSTFIQKVLDTLVIPNINNEYDKTRTTDSTPQSASGKTVMTTEPKFIPDDSVLIKCEDGTELNVKMIDCVGYLVDGALGTEEDGEARMVKTPWSESAIPFKEAAELGTSKVIGEHSTIGILVTTDGSFGELPREAFVEAEERVAGELNSIGKPFAILLNSETPESEESINLAHELEKKYSAPVALLNCMQLSGDDIKEILKLVLAEFPITSLTFTLPKWTGALPENHRLYNELVEKIGVFADSVATIGDACRAAENFDGFIPTKLSAKDGEGFFDIPLSDDDYYDVMKEVTGFDISDRLSLFETMKSLSETEKKYKKIESALNDVNEKGYGIVMPTADELILDEPRLTKQSGGWGVKVCARAKSIHMIKTDIKTDLCPVVGTEEQSEEVVKYLLGELEGNPEKVWESNMFGKSLYDLVSDGMNAKLENIPEPSREKLGETLERVLNEGANGLICILL